MIRANTLTNVAIFVVAATALVYTAGVARHEFFPTPPVQILPSPIPVAFWHRFAKGGHTVGAAKGAVTIVVFADFQCPFCAALTDTLHALLARRRDVTVVFHQFPLSIHPFAEQAAEASECAAQQGVFTAYHDRLFANRDSIGVLSWGRFADEARVPDAAAFSACVASGTMKQIVQSDVALGKQLDVVATPTLIINGERYNGMPTRFDAVIRAAVSASH